MSSLRGIAKNLSALFSSHLVAVIQQVALVPFFIHIYGKAGYGEWLAISAAVSYLGTLDFGIQTFVNQDLTVRYHRGDMEDFHKTQSTALRLLLGIIATTTLLCTTVFLMPLQHLLHMDGFNGDPIVPGKTLQASLFFMALQALVNLAYGYFGGTFMVLGRAHIGAYWNNAKSLAIISASLMGLYLHASFALLAGMQLGAVMLCFALQVVHLRHAGPLIFPTLRYWNASLAVRILKPSGYFALIYSSNFLVYQLPVLILQHTLGGTAVTIFSVMRTIFSMTRSMLNALTQAIGPEVTRLFARNEWRGLLRLYDYSERLVFATIPVVNGMVLYLCPLLLTVWLKQPQLFMPYVYCSSAATSIVQSAKEHKVQFQFSTNTHRELARFMFWTYVGLAGVWVIAIPHYGVPGLVATWFCVELIQLLYISHLNTHLFREQQKLDKKYLTRLGFVSVLLMTSAYFVLPQSARLTLPAQTAISVIIGIIVLGCGIPLFKLQPALSEFRLMLGRRRGV